MSPKEPGDQRKILAHFQANPDTPIDIHELADAIGSKAKNLSRRVRALREQGWTILAHADRPSLKADQYVFPGGQTQGPSRKKGLSGRLRAEVLRRDGVCKMCGSAPGETHPFSGRRVVLHVHHIDDTLTGAELNDISNLMTRCNTCNEGSRNFDPPPADYQKIKAMLVATNGRVREKVYEYLKGQFDADKK